MLEIQQTLLTWYDNNQRDLPWRNTGDPYQVLVSEFMLQQTRVETVIPYYHRFIRSLPDISALADVDEHKLLKLWEGLGYYRRAKNLKRTAQQIVYKFNSNLPKTAADWEKLPGIGKYTAGALSSIIDGEQAALVDGNVKRVYSRIFGLTLPVNEKAGEEAVWDKAKELVPSARPGDYNQALMELGATVCLPKNPKCNSCPLLEYCKAFKQGIQKNLPNRSRKMATPQRYAVSAIIKNGNKLLILKRPSDEMLGDFWELPTIFLPYPEIPVQEIEKLFETELHLKVCLKQIEASARHAYTHFKILNLVYSGSLASSEKLKQLSQQYRWVSSNLISDFPVHVVQKKLLKQLFHA